MHKFAAASNIFSSIFYIYMSKIYVYVYSNTLCRQNQKTTHLYGIFTLFLKLLPFRLLSIYLWRADVNIDGWRLIHLINVSLLYMYLIIGLNNRRASSLILCFIHRAKLITLYDFGYTILFGIFSHQYQIWLMIKILHDSYSR